MKLAIILGILIPLILVIIGFCISSDAIMILAIVFAIVADSALALRLSLE